MLLRQIWAPDVVQRLRCHRLDRAVGADRHEDRRPTTPWARVRRPRRARRLLVSKFELHGFSIGAHGVAVAEEAVALATAWL